MTETPCTSLEEKTHVCLTKAELKKQNLGFVESLMDAGDPCFLFQRKKRVCTHY